LIDRATNGKEQLISRIFASPTVQVGYRPKSLRTEQYMAYSRLFTYRYLLGIYCYFAA